ncbi:hypothetical protein AVEN_96063-1 [Araneus ventricosus]|uniref:Uncharacterized protein n=1 Tax=Araneus ventricosus TaxID=182803 RepID=A0A4Y2B6Z9_ARAVE|nr:hypothetical protein AVEN_96063-1 [Araneus ventricosus]
MYWLDLRKLQSASRKAKVDSFVGRFKEGKILFPSNISTSNFIGWTYEDERLRKGMQEMISDEILLKVLRRYGLKSGDLVVRCRLLGRRSPGSKPTVHGACCTKNHTQRPNFLQLVWCGSLVRGWQFTCRFRHLPEVQNYEVHPKIALALFSNEMLI